MGIGHFGHLISTWDILYMETCNQGHGTRLYIFFSLFGPYSLKTLHYETVLYVFISGLGMFYFLKHFSISKNICLLIAVSFMLCGYNTDSSQFLNWISAASFLPFVLLFSYRSINESSWKLCLINGLFLFLFCFVSFFFVCTCFKFFF